MTARDMTPNWETINQRDRQPSEEHPVYRIERDFRISGTELYIVTVDEGWRTSDVCSGMYKWAAEWLVEQLQGKPFAPGRRP